MKSKTELNEAKKTREMLKKRWEKVLKEILLASTILLIATSLVGCNEEKIEVHTFINSEEYPCGFYILDDDGDVKKKTLCADADSEGKKVWYGVDETDMELILEYKLACDEALDP